MNLPNLPTDNLYKFIALSGVALFFSCFFVLIYQSEELLKAQKKLEMGKVLVGYSVNAKDANLDSMSADELKRLNMALDMYATVTPSPQEFIGYINEIKMLELHNQLWFVPLIIGLVTGLVIAFAGFWLWYRRLQRFQDKILKKESEKPIAS